jgi:excisionase family DNA binding protein
MKTYEPVEVAELVKVTRRTVYNWIYGGLLPAHKAGPKLWRVTEEELRAFLVGRGDPAAELLPPGPKPKRKYRRRTEEQIERDRVAAEVRAARRAYREEMRALEQAQTDAYLNLIRARAAQGDIRARRYLELIGEPLPAVVQSDVPAQVVTPQKPLQPMTPPAGVRNRAKKKSRR